MKAFKIGITLLTIGVLLTSCSSKTPETIIGIKLGPNTIKQIRKAENNGQLLRDNNGSYIYLPNGIKGYAEFYTTIKTDFLNQVIVRFCSKKTIGMYFCYMNPINLPSLTYMKKSMVFVAHGEKKIN